MSSPPSLFVRMPCRLCGSGGFTGALRPLPRSVLAASRLTELTRLTVRVCVYFVFNSYRLDNNDELHEDTYDQSKRLQWFVCPVKPSEDTLPVFASSQRTFIKLNVSFTVDT